MTSSRASRRHVRERSRVAADDPEAERAGEVGGGFHPRGQAERTARSLYIGHQARLMEREERRLCGRFALNLVVSPEDRDVLSQIAPDGRFLVVPNGVDTKAFLPAPPDRPREGIVFVGGQTWFPNRDGMEYFAQSILPLIRAHRPEVEVTWVGRAQEAEVRRYARMGIHMTGYVDDIRPFVHRATCFIVPLRVGGGTRLKIRADRFIDLSQQARIVTFHLRPEIPGGREVVQKQPVQHSPSVEG